MITNIDQLKSFIQWCKDSKIKKMKIDSIEFEISEIDFIDSLSNPVTNQKDTTGEYNTETLTDTLQDRAIQDDEDLYWSSST